MKKLALLGASGHGKVVADNALAAGWQHIVFFDDAWPQRPLNGRWPVVGDSDNLMHRLEQFDGVLVSIGHNATRWAKHQALMQAGAPMTTICHPAAWVSPHANLGIGSVVMAGAVINADAVVGQACIINTCASVDHDCQLGHAIHVAPGAHLSGLVIAGDGAWIGVGAAVKQGLHIGAGATVGAGAVVVKPVSDGMTVVGNPARPQRPHS